MESRVRILFENSIKSEFTRKQYMYHLQRFVAYYKLKDMESIVKIEQKQLQIMMEDYVMYLRTKISPNSFDSPLGGLQSFLEINDIFLNWKKIRKLVPARVKKSGARGYSDAEVRKMIEVAGDKRAKAIIHCLASSGSRIGGFEGMQLKHLMDMPNGCKACLIYPDEVEEYWSFFSPEAAKALDDYLEERRKDGEYIGPDSPVFRNSYRIGIEKPTPLARHSLTMIIYRVVNNAGLRKNKKNNRYEVQQDHGFRKRFVTKLKLNKEIPVAVTEKLVGHSRYRDESGTEVKLDGSYMRPEVDELFQYYQKAIPDLTVDDREKLLMEKQKILQEKSDLQRALMENELNKKELTDLKKWKDEVNAERQRSNMQKYGSTNPETT